MIKKWLVVFSSVAFLAFLLASIPHAMAQATYKWPGDLLITTPAVGTGSHASTAAWGSIMERMTGMKVRVLPDNSEGSRMQRLIGGEVLLNSASQTEPLTYAEGLEGFLELPKGDMRVIWHHNDTPWGWAVRGDSELKTIYDIKKSLEAGKKVRVAVNTSSASMIIWSEQVIPAFLGIGENKELMKNYIRVPLGSYPANVKSIAEGKADVAMVATISSVTYEIEAHPKGLRWLDKPLADKKGWAEVIKLRPLTIPSKLGIGVKSAIGREAWVSNFLYWGMAKTDPELAYQLAKWLHQNFSAYKDAHALCARMSMDLFREFLDYTGAPIHEGTIRYLKEIGKWTAKDDIWNQEAIKLMARYIDAWKKASAEAHEKKIKIAFDNKEWESLWNRYVKDYPKFKVRLE
ncbi:MAG: hypothetical protein FJ117_16330 [Deltaproteobacteria bacterium]|nr:hypothetical protein [Deltaproteobacteria bacterium]